MSAVFQKSIMLLKTGSTYWIAALSLIEQHQLLLCLQVASPADRRACVSDVSTDMKIVLRRPIATEFTWCDSERHSDCNGRIGHNIIDVIKDRTFYVDCNYIEWIRCVSARIVCECQLDSDFSCDGRKPDTCGVDLYQVSCLILGHTDCYIT